MAPTVPEVRIAVLGAASFAEVAHIPALNAHPHARVVALYSRDLERARALAARCGVSEATDDLAALLSRRDIDAVTIASSDDMHHPYAMAALAAGKHVLCEKPLALSERKAAEMTALARKAGVVHQVAFTFRHNFALSTLRRLLLEGEIGAPYYVEVHGEWLRQSQPGAAPTWREDAARHGHGELGEMGSHYIDTVNFLLGPFGGFISQITAVTKALTGNQTIDVASALLRTAGGTEGQFLISRATPAPAPYGVLHGDGLRGHLGYVVVTGERGALCASFSRGDIESLRRLRPGTEWEPVDLPGDRFAAGLPHSLTDMFARFVDAIRLGKEESGIAATFEDGYRAQAAIDAAVRAAHNLTWEEVPQAAP